MINLKNALIAIQARTTSTRFPGKVLASLDGVPVLDKVLDAARGAVKYINRNSQWSGIVGSVALVIPEGDKLKELYKNRVDLYEGSEENVLERYYQAAEKAQADIIVRITSDCPMVPQYLISKAITILSKGEHHFVSNAHPEFRTSIDGFDVEAMTFDALKWAHESAETTEQKEHVTKPFYELDLPGWLSVGHLFGFVDLSSVHLSIDEPVDLERVEKMLKRIKMKIKKCEAKHGKGSIYRF